MRVPLSWVQEFVPIDVDPGDLADRLSLTGLAVDEVLRIAEGVAGVVVAEVREIREHPDADNLMLVRAFDGSREHPIVCGARNYAVGDRVPLALPGARLPGGIEIGRRTVRGETSEGMLCSARELHIADDHSGILILDADAPLGADVAADLGLADVVFDIDVTPNRPDCLSIAGVAREIAAIYGLPFAMHVPVVPEEEAEAAALATVTVEDGEGCPRYAARVVVDLRQGSSPWWMRRRIMAAGMRPVSSVVDVTNYVLLERGQPLHAFDLDLLAGRAIVVRRPRESEGIETLDGRARALDVDDVVICDAKRPVAVAGIMGGADTEVSASTTRVLLESAYFAPQRIARTSRRLGLRSEASVRFERGVDPEAVLAAANRACELFASVCGASIARGEIDVSSGRFTPVEIDLRVARARTLAGAALDRDEMSALLASVGCGVDARDDTLRVTVPSFRPDITIEEDLVEEIARLRGYDAVRETLPPGARSGGLTSVQRDRRRARHILMGTGLSEAQTLSPLPTGLADRLGLDANDPLRHGLRLANPLSEDESVLRTSLIPGLLLAASRNAARRVLPVRLFEIGVTFTPAIERPEERLRAAWVLTGPAPRGWQDDVRGLDFFDAKGVAEALLGGLGIRDWNVESADAPLPFHPGRFAILRIGGRRAGAVGELRSATAESLELPARVAVAEIDLDFILGRDTVDIAPVIPRFPAVGRDLALIAPELTPAAAVEDVIRAAGGDLLHSVALFDVYRGDPVPNGCVSLAWGLEFRHAERTLTDADADAALARIVSAAANAGWSARE